jgi:thioredoxin 1
VKPARPRRKTGGKGRKGKGSLWGSSLSRALAFGALMLLVTAGLMIPRESPKAESPSGVLAVGDSSFKKEVMDSQMPVLVDFWATWCGPCRMYGPIVDRLALDYQGRLKVVRVDIDQNPQLTQDFQITGIPNSILFQKGRIVKAWVGLVSEDELKGTVDQVVGPANPDRNPKIKI